METRTDNNFSNAMKFPISLAQYFSLFPGSFNWKSWRILYHFVVIMGTLIYVLTELFKMVKVTFTIYELSSLVFGSSCLISMILFLKLSNQWSDFVNEWHLLENTMKDYDFSDMNLRKRLKTISITILSIAAVEHILVIAFNLKSSFDIHSTVGEALHHHFAVNSFSHVFLVLPYNIWFGLYFQLTGFVSTFVWTYLDVFIMLVSVALSYKLKLISKRVDNLRITKVNDILVWKKVREDYIRVCNLSEMVNAKISPFIVVSFSTNLYFVLLQIFSSLRSVEYALQKVYFYISFWLLLLRIICICIFGGNVYDRYKEILSTLSGCSSTIYNSEIERFVFHITTWEIALSGQNFFTVTRSLILKIAGAIVTYELILLQFAKVE